jgi:hypothetical protein
MKRPRIVPRRGPSQLGRCRDDQNSNNETPWVHLPLELRRVNLSHRANRLPRTCKRWVVTRPRPMKKRGRITAVKDFCVSKVRRNSFSHGGRGHTPEGISRCQTRQARRNELMRQLMADPLLGRRSRTTLYRSMAALRRERDAARSIPEAGT